jgi:hypothetical protein
MKIADYIAQHQMQRADIQSLTRIENGDSPQG